MRIHKLFPRLLVLCASFLFTAGAFAQSSDADLPSTGKSINPKGAIGLETQPVVFEEQRPRIAGAPALSSAPAARMPLAPAINLTNAFDKSLLSAIQSHVGATYHFNRTGPEEFDCSGLVWRAFQDVGVDFQRGPARSYWATFAEPAKEDQFKFGTLVFFSNLSHVGIVVDDKGFYHSARHGGVMYSPFNDYWLSRIDGFRRVPLAALQTPAAKTRPAPAKSGAAAATVEQNNQP
ncbi:MAG TPA: NlpC/P60 family protein [Pyrinomonadaceae bacterium]|nr:NlpC/P60 family protein [Pyrinomonadaceae bacterium]